MTTTHKGAVMKFNVIYEKDKGSYWVLSNGSHSFKSQTFKSRPEAIKDLERFVVMAEKPTFISSGEKPSKSNANDAPSLLITLGEDANSWHWEAWVSADGHLSKIATHSACGFETLESARESAKFACNAITVAPILDQADVAIPNMHFSNSFAEEYGVGDIHPSSKSFN
ncbi:hypothetical protein [Serratia liquefaciens]|uniref:hypothetical protein n=1 Tax=Serratia liquefaciens TaxID=614 RepID=UPI001F39401F|nr:hypothetical protein [Serratia liquefaciens]MCE9939485.1 hypothetical protein [Serratia liquefaciens]